MSLPPLAMQLWGPQWPPADWALIVAAHAGETISRLSAGLKRKYPWGDSDGHCGDTILFQCDRIKEFWWDDGNVILVDAQRSIACKVLRSPLERLSPVFTNLFRQPRYLVREDHGRIPLIIMHQDAKVFEVAMRVLLHYSTFEAANFKLDPFLVNEKNCATLISLFRLSAQYSFAPLRKAIVGVFHEFFHSDNMESDDDLSKYDAANLSAKSDFAIANALEERGLWTRLPMALYRCALHDTNAVDKSPLSEGNKAWVMQALQHVDGLATVYKEMIRAIFEDGKVAEGCTQRAMKNGKVCKLRIPNMESFLLCRNRGFPLDDWKTMTDVAEVKKLSVCKACLAFWGKRWNRRKAEAWQRMPKECFGIVDGWQQLKDAETAFVEPELGKQVIKI